MNIKPKKFAFRVPVIILYILLNIIPLFIFYIPESSSNKIFYSLIRFLPSVLKSSPLFIPSVVFVTRIEPRSGVGGMVVWPPYSIKLLNLSETVPCVIHRRWRYRWWYWWWNTGSLRCKSGDGDASRTFTRTKFFPDKVYPHFFNPNNSGLRRPHNNLTKSVVWKLLSYIVRYQSIKPYVGEQPRRNVGIV